MQPLKFSYLLKSTLWAGTGVERLKGLPASAKPIGESWEISGLPGHETPVLEGEHKGETLSALIGHYGAGLVGSANLRRYGTTFPLLVKFISAASDLSIQVHPDDAMARRLGHPNGKTEMWYVVDAEPGASLISGFCHDFSAEAYTAALADGTLPKHLNHLPARRGDSFFIPAARIHSIGAGNLVIEIQQDSDDTFRVYDYDRVDKDGHKRELHVEQAREALDYKACADSRIHYAAQPGQPVTLVSCPQFTVRLLQLTEAGTVDYADIDSFVVYIAYEGFALLCDSEGTQVTLRAGETVMFPATNTSVRIVPQAGRFECIETFVL